MIKLWQGSNELFGGEPPAHVRKLIDAAKQGPRELFCEQLWAIQAHAPTCLPVYYLLYKVHSARRELAQAERAALAGLAAAGLQSGLPTEVSHQRLPAALNADFESNGPARFWLFTLKALAFIRMRRGQLVQARQALDWLERCDPERSIGSDVTFALLAATGD